MKKEKSEFERSQNFQNIVMQIATQFVNIEENDISLSINAALKMVGEFIQTDRIYVFLYHFDENYMENTFEWCNQGIEPAIEQLKHVPMSDFIDDWVTPHSLGNLICVEDVSKLPKEGNLYSILSMQKIQSLLTIPMFSRGNCLGFVGFDSVKSTKHYGKKEIALLGVISKIITNLITKKKQQELMAQGKIHLDEIRKNFESFFNTIEDFLFVLDEGGNILYANNTVIVRLGYSIEELMGKSIMMVHPSGRRSEAGRIVGEMLAGTAAFCPVPIETKNGIQIPVETRVTRGVWDGKNVLFGVTKDISQLKLSEEKFSKTFHLNPFACGLSDIETRQYTEVNQNFCNLFGFSKEEVIGKTAIELGIMTPDNIDAISKKMDSSGHIVNAETEVKTKNGTIRYVYLSSDNIWVQDKKYRYTVVNDFTERKMMEKQLQEANEMARQKQISNDIAKSNFIADMSHEIRTPLSGVYNSIYLLDNSPLSMDQRAYLNIANFSLESLSAVINDVLDLSKFESGKITLDLHSTDLEDEMVQLAKNQKSIACERGIGFALDYDYSIPYIVSIDKMRLRQILMNLLNNAIKFTEIGQVALQIKLLERQSDFALIDFAIVDTGIGISQEKIPLLTQKFFQINPADSQKQFGTGLGLSIVKELLRLMGSELKIKSDIGKGSTFSFSLKLQYQKSSKSLFPSSIRAKKVLLVTGLSKDQSNLERLFSSMNVTISTIDLNDLLKSVPDPSLFDFIVFSLADEVPSTALLECFTSLPNEKILIMEKNIDFDGDAWKKAGINHYLVTPFTRKTIVNELTGKVTANSRAVSIPSIISSNYRLLIVDDNRINRQSMTIILNQAGFITSTAQNAFEALDMIKTTHFDMLLVDIQMPGMDGYEMTRVIRGMGGKFANLLIVALTANTVQSTLKGASEAGMNGAISKPVKPDELLKLIVSYLQDIEEPELSDIPRIRIPNDLKVFDSKAFLDRFGDSKELIHELLSAYLEDYQSDLEKIGKAIDLENPKGIDEAVHYFIGSVSNVGAEKLLWLCNRVKQDAKKENLTSMKTLFKMMKKESNNCSEAMADWLEEGNDL